MILVLALLTFAWIRLKHKKLVNIKAKTVHMQQSRMAVIASELNHRLVEMESVSRRSAYTNTPIQTGEQFFDDSDMRSDYYLVTVYDSEFNTPLLTARYYFDLSVIAFCLVGGNDTGKTPPVDLSSFEQGEIFLADRLSGNVSSAVYRRYRTYIFLLLYAEVYRKNKSSRFILMARKEKSDKLLAKYLQLGLSKQGSTIHRGREHWILLGDTAKSYSRLSRSSKIIITLRNLFLPLMFEAN